MTEFEWLDIFGDNLVNIMNDTKISQRDLADITGLSEGTISKYIHKQQLPGIKAIINIAYALECDVSELIDFGDKIL